MSDKKIRQNLFQKETEELEEFKKELANYNLNDSERARIQTFCGSYHKLLQKTSKLINIGDSNQRKLQTYHEKLLEGNKIIKEQNDKLKKASSVKQRYLNIINSELDVAADYVRSLLPEPIRRGRARAEWLFRPSKQLGGDAFGYHWIDEDFFAIYLFDVCGHGVGPAIHSISALHTLRFQTLPDINFREPSDVLNALNQSFQMKYHNDMFFTIWYGVYNVITGEMKYSAAGHQPSLIINPDGEMEELFSRNLMIGVDPDFEYSQKSYTLETPSRLFIFSDGVFEAIKEGGDRLEFGEMKDILMRLSAKYGDIMKTGGEDLTDLMDEITDLNGGRKLKDDFSIIRANFL